MTRARQTIDLAMSETEWQHTVVDLARSCGFLVNHTRRAVVRDGRVATPNSQPGWPDLEILGHGRLIYAELKSETGRLRPEQKAVIAELERAEVDVRVWRPRHWNSVVETLTRGRTR